MESQKNRRLTKKKFAHMLQFPLEGQFVTPTIEQIFHMFDEMGYQPPITLLISFKKKDNLPSVWNFFFGIVLRCLTGRSTGMDKAKLQFYSIIAGLY